jgi:hypothetical protein
MNAPFVIGEDLQVHIVDVAPNASPAGKLAEAEVEFLSGTLTGLAIVGFALWAPRPGGNGRINVSFPARTYSVRGERRAFAVLRPTGDDQAAHDRLCDLVRAAYEAHVRAPKVPR